MARAQQFNSLHTLRGIAAFLIVYAHTEVYTWGYWPEILRGAVIGVDLFFMLSGFVLMHTYAERLKAGQPPLAFLRSRMVRLIPLYLLGFVIGVAAMTITLAFGPGRLGLGLAVSTLANFFMLPGPSLKPEQWLYPVNIPAWTLFFEILMCAAFAFFTHRWSIRRLAVGVVAAGAALTYLVGYFGHLDLGSVWATFWGGMARAAFGFLAGMLVYKLRERTNPGPAKESTPMVLALLGVLLVSFLPGITDDMVGGLRNFSHINLALALFFSPVMVWIAAGYNPGPRMARIGVFLGTISYAVYILHLPIVGVANAIAGLVGVPLESLAPWPGLAVFPLVLLVAWAAEKYLDRPARAWLDGKRQRAVARPVAVKLSPEAEKASGR